MQHNWVLQEALWKQNHWHGTISSLITSPLLPSKSKQFPKKINNLWPLKRQIILNSYIDQFHLNFQLNKTHDYKEQASHRIFKVFIIFVKVGILHIYDIHKHGRLTNWHYANRTFMVHSRFSNKCTVFLSKHLMIFDIK